MYLTRFCERVVDIEEEDCVLEGTLLERGVNGCCESHVEVGFGVQFNGSREGALGQVFEKLQVF